MTKWAWQLVTDITHGTFSGSATSRLQPTPTAIQGVPLLTLTLTHKAFTESFFRFTLGKGMLLWRVRRTESPAPLRMSASEKPWGN